MSLAKDDPPRRRVRQNGTSAKDVRRLSCEPRDFRDILTRVFESYANEPPPTPEGGSGSFATLHDGRIDLDALRVQCDRLEGEVRSIRQRNRLDAEALVDESARWQDLAEQRGEELHHSQTQLAEALGVTARLQSRLEAESAKLDAAQHRNRMLEQIAMALHDTILESFRLSDPRARPLVAAAA